MTADELDLRIAQAWDDADTDAAELRVAVDAVLDGVQTRRAGDAARSSWPALESLMALALKLRDVDTLVRLRGRP